MALLRQTATDALSALGTEHLVGRSRRAALQIDKPYVSAQHACVRWVGSAWELKDLGSRNGTLVNDLAIQAGQPFTLTRGDRISFGRTEQTWELVDDSPPKVTVVPLESGGEPMFAEEGGVLAVPSQDDPQATVFYGSDGVWRVEREDEIVALANHQVFEVASQRFRFSCPDVAVETKTIDWPEGAPVELARLRLRFRVSRDEEHVEMQAALAKQTWDLGSRGHNYLLLLLARHRLHDAAGHLPDTMCGWVYQEEVVASLRTSSERLNIDIFRIRRQFAGIGVSDAAHIIERRPGSRQLRIGVAALSIEPI
jgi:pSer/pThr/pTyr-binding forkhead associated (FHA) protein